MRRFLADLRFSARSLRASPWLAATAILAMALGIGLTTTIYGVIDAAMLRGLPVPEGNRIVAVRQTVVAGGYTRGGVPARDFLDLRERQRDLDGLAAYDEIPMNLSGDEQPERVNGGRLTAGAFRLLRVQPVLGRGFVPADEVPGAPRVVVLGDALWRSRYQADPRIVGRVVRIDAEPATVIGVMGPGMRFPATADLWMPIQLDRAALGADGGEWFGVVGRLRPGANVEAVARGLTAVQAAIGREHAEKETLSIALVPYVQSSLGSDAGILWTMLAAVALVLVVACVNVANLLLARAAARAREIGVRAALGASRVRVVALFLTESLALSAVGALAGLGVAWVGMRIFTRAIADTSPPFWIVLRMDARVLAFVAGATVVAAVVAGCLPALQAARSDVNVVLKDGARGVSGVRVGRVSRALVIGELALSCGLLVGAGLMVSTISKLRTRDFGVDTHGTFTARVLLPRTATRDSVAVARFPERLVERLHASGVATVAVASALPVADGSPAQQVRIEGESNDRPPLALRVAVSPGYFPALGARLADGRDFDERDAAGAPDVAFVNRAFARRYLGAGSPLGRRLVLEGTGKETRTVTVVGLAPDVSPGGTNARNIQEAVYVPLAQWPATSLAIAARGGHTPLALAAPIRAVVASLDRDAAVTQLSTLATQVERRTWFYRVFGGAFAIFGAAALFLAALGLYAVMAASVARRAREMGVRIALGASTGGILGLVLRQGGVQVAIGGALGLVFGFGLSQLLRGLLFGVKPGDPVVTLGVVAVLACTGLLASLVPALRASRADPMRALRTE